jgi:hypothetical protein
VVSNQGNTFTTAQKLKTLFEYAFEKLTEFKSVTLMLRLLNHPDLANLMVIVIVSICNFWINLKLS